jgi:hypothetical protein
LAQKLPVYVRLNIRTVVEWNDFYELTTFIKTGMRNIFESKFEIIYYNVNFNRKELEQICGICKQNNWRLIIMMPVYNNFPSEINYCLEILNDDCLIYEMEIGLMKVLKARALKYKELNTNSELWEIYNS